MSTPSDAKRVLVVDDETNIRMTVTQALEAGGFAVETAPDGERALAVLQDHRIALVLLDLKMPGMSGLDVLGRVRREWPEVKVILVTAYGTIDAAVEAMKLGAVDFVQKPFTPAQVRELVGRALDQRALHSAEAQTYDAHIALAQKCLRAGRLAGAEEEIRSAIGLAPTKPQAFNLMGVLLEMRGKALDAQNSYRAALSLAPAYVPASRNLDRTSGLVADDEYDLGANGGADH